MDGRTDGRDGQTDGQAIAYSALSIYVICCSALKILFLFIIAVNTSVLTFITDGRHTCTVHFAFSGAGFSANCRKYAVKKNGAIDVSFSVVHNGCNLFESCL